MSDPVALVLGSGVNFAEVARALRFGGVHVALGASGSLSARLERCSTVEDHDGTAAAQAAAAETCDLVQRLVRYGQAQPARPALFFVTDQALLLISRHREQLARAFRFVIAAPGLVEDLVDKATFANLVRGLPLPSPVTHVVHTTARAVPVLDLSNFPLVVKPSCRNRRWHAAVGQQKAVTIDGPEALRQLWPLLAGVDGPVLLQQLVPGPESRVESYHVYVDADGRVVAEYAGRKVRTLPSIHGHTTALVITDTPDVLAAGRDVVQTLGLTGVAKCDFKRAEDGRLLLLEVNPRFHLWHHPGALAGINMPALVHADLAGLPRPHVAYRDGVRWVRPRDRQAAARDGVSAVEWARWALACETKGFWWGDSLSPLTAATAVRLASHC